MLLPCALAASDAAAEEEAPEQPLFRQQIVVTGTYEPVPLEEADRPVTVIDAEALRPLTNTWADLLRLDASVDLRQRSPNGLQGDLSIRGATFGQTLVLLDGLRLNDVQSGHHNLDVPAPLEALKEVQTLKGSGSTLYGSDAVGGVVNFITRAPEHSEMRVRAAAGNLGVNQQQAVVTLAGANASQQFTGSRDFSSGFMPNREYRNLSLGSATRVRSALGWTNARLFHRDSPFGAENFYGLSSSWERTRTWWASARQELGSKTEASFAFRRHTDLFVFDRRRPGLFTNRHAVESYQFALRRRDVIRSNAKLHYGAEAYGDSIASSNLGNHDRMRGAAYVAFDVRTAGRFSFSAGVRDEVFGPFRHEASPTVTAAAWLTETVRVRGVASRAFRLPTYTELYYWSPDNRGSPDLRPERAWSYEGGVEWTTGRARAELTVFQRRETDGIDFVRASAADVWRATNFQRLQFTGVEASVRLRVAGAHTAELHYTGLRGAQDALGGYMSKYVFNYPVHSGIVAWQGARGALTGRTRFGAAQRFGRDPYAVWDVYAAWNRGRVRPLFQMTNLLATRYEEIPLVAMPGRAIVGGIEVVAFGLR
ncbi:MAG: TonB-dependent receptor [Bryobacteraceae bacterium]|nr:TonB-dependent receptor [Bryobacteraceae bacterium]